MVMSNIFAGKTAISLPSLFAALPVAVVLVDRHGNILAANPATSVLQGHSPEAVVGRKVSEFHQDATRNLARDGWLAEAGLTLPDHEMVFDGRHYQVSVRPVRDDNGNVTAFVIAFTDISRLKRVEQRLSEANRRLKARVWEDHLTGIPSRRYLDAALAREIRRARRSGQTLSVVMADIDRFKSYNDRYGHPAGDDCLRLVAQAAAAALGRGEDELCRYGGEEFVAILPGSDLDGAARVAERMRQAVADLAIPHDDVPSGHVTISLGVAGLPPRDIGSQRDRDALIAAADRALYAAKAAGRDRVARAGQDSAD
ncbi:GGDEF family protein [Tistrella mobilis KA081020-065]|uniref:diguanylate cyclase n=2 Tax=Tistrella mobilis TaxID=171437 RepID=I3TK05_TISMK|nr:GGDEF family protein [Tistrella mobilis KA081020-065]